MADKAVDFTPTDHFNLGSDYEVKTASKKVGPAVAVERKSSDGKTIDESCEFDTVTTYSATYEYNGADLVTDFVVKVGQVVNGIYITGVSAQLSAQGILQITIDGHNHGSNAHAAAGTGEFDGYAMTLSTLVGAAQGSCGINDGDKPFANSDGDSDLVSLSITWSCNHVDEPGSDGEHWAGDSFAGKVEVSCEYVGTPTLTTTGWYNVQVEDGEGSEQADKTTVTAWKPLATTVGA